MNEYLEMEVVAAGKTRGSAPADDLTSSDRIAFVHLDG